MLTDLLAARSVAAPAPLLDVPLRTCVHPYTAFRYGAQEYNPYETYQIELNRGVKLSEVRRKFIEFLRHYRPRHFGDALGISLTHPWASCVYPWEDRDPGDWQNHGWRADPDDIPDLLTHFSEAGIPSVRIDEEFMWLERSLRAISEHGYLPEKYGPAEALELRRVDGSAAYLLLDGNHRAGALVALGCSATISVRCHGPIRERDVDRWPSVRLGRIARQDALAIFAAFFSGNSTWKPSARLAEIIAPNGWKELYLSQSSPMPK